MIVDIFHAENGDTYTVRKGDDLSTVIMERFLADDDIPINDIRIPADVWRWLREEAQP